MLLSFDFGNGRILVGRGVSRDANRVPRLKEFDRSFPVDAENSVFYFGVGRGIDAAREKFVTRFNIFARGIASVLKDDGIAGLRDSEVRLGGDNHAERLHVSDGFYLAVAAFESELAEIFGTTLRGDGP